MCACITFCFQKDFLAPLFACKSKAYSKLSEINIMHEKFLQKCVFPPLQLPLLSCFDDSKHWLRCDMLHQHIIVLHVLNVEMV